MTSAKWIVAALVFGVGVRTQAFGQTLSQSVITADTAILSQFNLVTFGNYTEGNETEGRVVVGGNLNANTNNNIGFNGHGGSTSTAINNQQYGSVTVFGNVTAGFNPGGNTFIAGTASGTFNNLNGANFNVVGSAAGATISGAGQIYTSQSSFAGTAMNTPSGNINTGVSSATVFPYGSSISTNFQTPLTTLSTALAALPTTAGVTAQALPNPTGGNLNFTANADYKANGLTYGVITTTYDNLASEQNFSGINNNGNAATIVLVTGNDPNAVLPSMNSNNTASDIIWDFVNATVLQFAGTWYGTILAPSANITQQGGDLDGPVVANSLTQTHELHFNDGFNGNLTGLQGVGTPVAVPEPSTIALTGSGVMVLGLLRRRGSIRARVVRRQARF